MKIEISYFTTVGKYRENNQDALLIMNDIINNKNSNLKYCKKSLVTSLNDKNIFAISDGMGGLEAGNKASEIILKTLKKNSNKISKTFINTLLTIICKNLDNFSQDNDISRIGGTLSFLKIENNFCKLFNIGDTRIYQLDNKKLKLLSKDHSLAYKAYLNKKVAKEAIRFHPKKNILTSCLTNNLAQASEFFYSEFLVKPGDTFLICSDGVWENFSSKEIKHKLLYKKIGNISRFLLKEKYEHSFDNLSAIIIKVEE